MTQPIKFLVYLTALLTTSVFGARPNVILVMADDLGWGDLRCYNTDSPIDTPHLDAMASNGVKFQRFYSASAVCSPTRASCLTGRNPIRVGVPGANSGHFRKEEIGLQELLKDAGYRTGHFGKWHLGTLSKTVPESNRGGPKGVKNYAPPWEHGFDVCFSTEAKVPTWDPMVIPKKPESEKTWWEPVKSPEDGKAYGTHYWNQKGELQKDNLAGDDSRVVMDRAVEFIEGAVKDEKPFFSVIWFHSPHLPVVTGGKYAKRYADEDGHAKAYYGCITALDDQMGRLRKTLRQLGVAGDTMVWFCADNGPEGNSKSPGQTNGLKGRKRDLYEGGIRVPGILEWPAGVGTKGMVVDVPAVTSDYLPTILEATKIEYPSGRPLDGLSLLPILRGDQKERGKGIGFIYGGKSAWMEDEWKVVLPKGKKDWELYNIVADPGEMDDRAAAMPDQARRMAAVFADFHASCQQSLRGADYQD